MLADDACILSGIGQPDCFLGLCSYFILRHVRAYKPFCSVSVDWVVLTQIGSVICASFSNGGDSSFTFGCIFAKTLSSSVLKALALLGSVAALPVFGHASIVIMCNNLKACRTIIYYVSSTPFLPMLSKVSLLCS